MKELVENELFIMGYNSEIATKLARDIVNLTLKYNVSSVEDGKEALMRATTKLKNNPTI